MNNQATIFGYLAFSCLQKLIKQASLVKIHSYYPYVSIVCDMPFELQDTVLTVMQEDLRGILKSRDFQVLDMVPEVALNYARSKQHKLELLTNEPVISLLETKHSLIQITPAIDEHQQEVYHQFEHVQSLFLGNRVIIHFALGSESKDLKKVFTKNASFSAAHFLVSSSFIDMKGRILDRGQSVLEYYKNIFTKESYKLGMHFAFEPYQDSEGILSFESNQAYEDPLTIQNMQIIAKKLTFKCPFGFKKLNSFLKSHIKILTMLGFMAEVEFQGKFAEGDFNDLQKGIDFFEKTHGPQKRIFLTLKDSFERKIPVVSILILKKNIECEIDILKIILMHVFVHKKLFPDNQERPLQVAVAGSLDKHPELLDELFKARLKGSTAYLCEHKDVISDKQALDYQIDNLVYYSGSDKGIKIRSF